MVSKNGNGLWLVVTEYVFTLRYGHMSKNRHMFASQEYNLPPLKIDFFHQFVNGKLLKE